MKYLSIISSVFIILFFAFSCINNKKSTETKDKIENAEWNPTSISGLYSGDLPCVDCESIRTILELNKDQSFKLRYVYEGKSADQFVKEGNWSIVKNKVVLGGVDYKYKIGKDHLIQLDLSENEIKGDLAESYYLAKLQ